MGYYSVMLVDDEEEVRQAIIKRVDWESIGFRVVDSAENGEEALEKAERLCPDVVMTDIQMPFMDGLTFCKKLKERISGTKIVIFSGYDEFEYAKEAIKLEAEEYILKPIDASELKQVFSRIKERLDEEMDQKRNVERLEKYYLESMPVLKEQFLMSLLEGRLREKRIEDFMDLYGIKMDAPYYAVSVFRMDIGSGQGMLDAGLLSVSLKQIIDEQIDKQFMYRSINYLGTIIVIVMLTAKTELSPFIQVSDRICKFANRILGIHTTAGIGHVCDSLMNLHHSYEEALAAVEYRILMELNQAIFIQDIEPKSEERFLIEEKELQSIVKEIKVGTKEELEQAVHSLIEKLKSSSISMTQLQISFTEMIVEIMRLARVYEVNTDEIEGLNVDFYSEIKNFESLDALGDWLLSVCMQLRGQIRRERTDTTKLLIDKAKQYIEEHYNDCELSVEKLCGYLGLSATYFSTLFKRETGFSFVAYLTQTRMENALRLLNTTEEKAYIISELVGYTEPNYFSYVFKKQYGVSPSKYRTNQGSTN
ncbi:MAG TPA: response regulator [Lachnospiraceae bacterium]|jgi:two-component system, response regulator YesN|nr:response regulator [Lachnospiraceae bacterium]